MRKHFSGSAFARECPYSSGIHRRAAVFFAFCAVAFTLLYLRVGYLSRSPGLAQTARQQSKYTLAVSKTRGGIYDCRLRPLVNGEQEKVWAVLPSAENLTAVRKAVPASRRGEVSEQLKNGRPFLLRGVSDIEAPGADAFFVPVRSRDRQLAAHIVGYTDGGVAGDWGKRLLNKAAETSTGKALLSNVPQKVVDFLGTLSKNKVAQVVGTGLEEGFENLTEYDLQRMWQNLILDEDTPYDIRQAMSEAASGVLFGSIMAAGNAAGDTLRTKTGDFLEGRQWRQGEWGTLLENAARSSDPSVRQDAADILSGLARGKSPSSEELGSLARRVRATGTDADVPLFEGVEPKKTAAERLADQLAAGAMKKSPRTEQGPVIREGMTDTERVQTLRDTQVSVPEAKPERLEGVDLGELETAIKSQARQYIRPLAEKLGVFKNYQNDNVDLEFSYTKGGFDESIHKQKDRGGRYDDFAKMFSVFDELVQNAVPIEFHGDKYAGTKRADADLNRVAVLVSAFQDGDRIVPVQFEIKEKNKYTNKLYVSVTLQDIKTEPGVVGGAGQLLDPVTPPTRVLNYSISQLLEGVNPEDTDFLKYVPDGFLSWSQQAGKQRGILAEQEKLRKLRQENPVDTILNAGQGPAAENPAVDADAETKAVETLLQPAKERETARKRLADTLARQIIVNKDGWTQADMEEARRIRGRRRKTNARSVGYSE